MLRRFANHWRRLPKPSCLSSSDGASLCGKGGGHGQTTARDSRKRGGEDCSPGAGRITTAAKPILEVNPRHPLIVSLAGLGEDEKSFKDDAAHLLLDEARVLDGERPADARGFSDRLARVLERGLRPAA
jgi:HSP90 family molecular chaperone